MHLLHELKETFSQQNWIKKVYDCWLVVCFVLAILALFGEISLQAMSVLMLPMVVVGYFVRLVVYLKG
jgi:hypothetical protein